MAKETMAVTVDLFERILNCLANKPYIGEMTEEVQEDWQQTFDDTWNEGMSVLSKFQQRYKQVGNLKERY